MVPERIVALNGVWNFGWISASQRNISPSDDIAYWTNSKLIPTLVN